MKAKGFKISRRAQLIVGGSIIIGLCFFIGVVAGGLSYEPKVIEIEVIKTEYITIVQEVPVLMPYEVEKPIYITITKEVPYEVATTVYRDIFPRTFNSVASFKEWYEEQGFGRLFEGSCNDYSARLQREALKQGYLVSQALALNGKYYSIKVTNIPKGHAGNLVLIDNTYYWVEPQPDSFEVIKITKRD